MIIFKKRNVLKQKLAESGAGRSCPACGTFMEFVEGGKDRATYTCPGCKEVATFTNKPTGGNQPTKQQKGKSFTLRDKSSKSSKHPSTKPPVESQAVTDVTDAVKTIRECMEDQNILLFEYNAHNAGFSARTVEPYKLTRDKTGDIVLYGFDIESEGIRIFKLSKMKNMEKQTFVYKPRWDLEDKLEPPTEKS